MKKKYLFVSSKYYIKTKESSILFVDDDEEEQRVHFDDIAALVIDNCKSTITVSCISKLAENDILIIINNNRHMPVAIVNSLSHNYNVSEKIKYQVKRYLSQDALWKLIVRAKITNQITVLDNLGFDRYSLYLNKQLAALKTIDQVDPIEALSAREFFKIYGSSYNRHGEHIINVFQNYGYSIIRSTIVQYLIINGLTPQIGIHHKSNTNLNNLADDFIEPYRPLVDYYIYKHLRDESELNATNKKMIIEILDSDVKLGIKYTTVRTSIKLFVESYSRYLVNNGSITEIQLVEYEF